MNARLICAACLLLPLAHARAEEARYNIHVELAPLFTVLQPEVNLSEAAMKIPGAHLRAAFEWTLHERFGLEAAYGVDLLFSANLGSLRPNQVAAIGARFRPWWNRRGGFLLPRPPPDPTNSLFIVDVLSDVWIDAHAAVSVIEQPRFAYDIGIGTRIPVIWPLQLGLFARWQHLVTSGQYMQVMVGLTVSAGFKAMRIQDGDGDGVLDRDDRCPDTTRGVRVNDRGCEWRESDTAAPTCGDTDLDGVCDGQDDCPDTRAKTPVDKKGCPIGGEKEPGSEE